MLGGQHVNKTNSAVRATHKSSGITVKVQTERSQHTNKRLAILLIAKKWEDHIAALQAKHKAIRRRFHHQIERETLLGYLEAWTLNNHKFC